MKYSEKNKPLVCMQTTSACYKGTKKMSVKGVLWHSTGANNPNIKRYVQPSDNAADREEMLEIIGVNTNKNDWNHTDRRAGMNCFIGKIADGSVTTVQTMPWDYRPWGCGSGPKGTCNDGWIQFEICEDGLTDSGYFNKIYREACEITAYLCKLYGLDPKGKVSFNGVQVPVILCHADSYSLGLGSSHGDVLHWFPKHGKSMDDVRADVAALMAGDNSFVGSPDSSGPDLYPSDTEITNTIESVLIQGVSILDTSATEVNIELKTSDKFNDYAWTYKLTSLRTAKTIDDVDFSVNNSTTKLKLDKLIPNTAYLLELAAEDDYKEILKSPGIIFSTSRAYPQDVTNVSFNLASNKVYFTSPDSWGGYTWKNRGYRVGIAVNGEVLVTDDSVISGSSEGSISKVIKNLISEVTVNTGDILQIGIQPWVEDDYNDKIFSTSMIYSKSVYKEPALKLVDKLFVKSGDSHKQAILHLSD